MKVILNGKLAELEDIANIDDLLLSQGYKGKTVAVAVNNNFVPRSLYDTHIINDGDCIEVVAPMQGG